MIPAPEPGLYRDVPAETYHRWDAVNASSLVTLLQETPAALEDQWLHPKADTKATTFGTLLHSLLLEEHALEKRYAVGPEVDRRTIVGKATWNTFVAETLAAGKAPMEATDWAKARAMRDACWRDRAVRTLLEDPSAVREASIVWIDPGTGLACKCRPDLLIRRRGLRICIDVKTAHNATRKAFANAMVDYGYYLSAPWYLRGLDAIAPGEWQYLWLAVDKRKPHLPALYWPGPRALEQGAEDAQRMLNVYATCRELGVWPGHNADGEPQVLELPRWAWRRDDGLDYVEAPDTTEDQEGLLQ